MTYDTAARGTIAEDPHGWDAFWTLYESGLWGRDTRELIGATLSPGDLFVDVGAWIGPVTLWAAAAGAHVIAVEPDPVANAELTYRTAGLNVQIWRVAVGTRPGRGWPARPDDDDDGANVQVWTLRDILGPARPKLVRIDTGVVELMSELAPWLASRGSAVQVACHGALPDREAFNGYAHVTWPQHTWGDVVAIP